MAMQEDVWLALSKTGLCCASGCDCIGLRHTLGNDAVCWLGKIHCAPFEGDPLFVKPNAWYKGPGESGPRETSDCPHNMPDHNQDLKPGVSSKPAELRLLWDPVQVFQFPSDTLEDYFSCVDSTCTPSLRGLYREESRTGSNAELLKQHYEKLAGTKPADIRPIDLQSLAEMVLCSRCRSRDRDVWIQSWAKQIGCWRYLLQSRNVKISELETELGKKEKAYHQLIKKTRSLRRQRVSDSSRAATHFMLEKSGVIFPTPSKPEDRTDEQMEWRLKVNEELALGWRWNPIVTLKLRHDFTMYRFICNGSLRNADSNCDQLISESNHKKACLLLDLNARLKPDTFGLKEPNRRLGLEMLALKLQCEGHAKSSQSMQTTMDRWNAAVSDEARVRRDYDHTVDQIATLQLSLSRKTTEYRKVLYGFVEELLEKQQWAESDVEAEFNMMRDVYTSLEKKVQPLDKELDGLKTRLDTLYDNFHKKEETWAWGGWYE